MGVLLAFFVGWAVGAKSGAKGYQDVVDAAKAVNESEEFKALVAIARVQVANSLQEIGKIVSGEAPMPDSGSLLERVARLTRAGSTT